MIRLIVAFSAVFLVFYVSCLDWRKSVKAVFFLVVMEGALRKWVLPQASELIYFLKDFVLLGAYFQYYFLSALWRKAPPNRSFINVLIFLVLGWGVFQLFNTSLGSPIVGIWGMKNYLYYAPMMWMLPSLFPTEEDFYKFLRSHLLLLIPVGILGIVQYMSPVNSPINAYAPGQDVEAGIAVFGLSNRARITSTFAYINNYVPYLFVCFGLLIALFTKKQNVFWLQMTIAELILASINAFLTGSRTTIFAIGIFLIGYFSFKFMTQIASAIRLLKWTFAPVVFGGIALFYGFQTEVDRILDRILYSGDVADRIYLVFAEPFFYIKYKELDAFGPGSTHQATGILRSILGLPYGEIPPVVESEMGKIMLEIGPIGFTFWYVLRVGILLSLFFLIFKLKRPFLRELALVAFLIQLIWIPGQLVFHITFSVYYWFLSGFIFLLPYLEKVENWSQYQQDWQNYTDEESSYLPNSPYG
ncbi:hypothetical protein QPK87_12795 [Kamptonema cortianum]|uniref:Oligosaccharide repeat unit polymerase n=1 Tax=Geitlerinema calcuttense NRMC-F 0142 TaxID=2922238 RepID=A0ABT7LYA4_9CYAN|nr:hypothetical protein [Geitlerinema calcuttense]MDI9640274.1 hypothetical protein [Geitlerinema splendidum]MDK3157445.1 hypothetical protein [Kamptonema cortianum]MDL5046841.1 hypothetical protein [Oscillatoria amoena NRMC-F 0135]MDL5056989.1 hypothetical protein [Geitlerinema calcuttense NRMC-F 0142]